MGKSSPVARWTVGDIVEVNYQNKGFWISGSITNIDANGSINIVLDNGKKCKRYGKTLVRAKVYLVNIISLFFWPSFTVFLIKYFKHVLQNSVSTSSSSSSTSTGVVHIAPPARVDLLDADAGCAHTPGTSSPQLQSTGASVANVIDYASKDLLEVGDSMDARDASQAWYQVRFTIISNRPWYIFEK